MKTDPTVDPAENESFQDEICHNIGWLMEKYEAEQTHSDSSQHHQLLFSLTSRVK